MSEVTFKTKPIHGVAAAVVAVVFIGLRLATMGESDDPELRAAVQAELLNDLGGNLGRALEDVDVSDPADIAAVLELADEANIDIHSIQLSRPILSMSTNEKTIARVEYTLPGASRRSEYWRMSNGLVGGWRYRGPSTQVSYYLNLL